MMCKGSAFYTVLTASFDYCNFFVVVVPLPRTMTNALGKEGSFAEGPSNSSRQTFFWKNLENFFINGE